MFQNKSCCIDGLKFDKYSLIERCIESYWFKFFFNLLIGITMFLCVHPNILSVSLMRWIFAVIIVSNLIIIKRIAIVSKKIDRIFENGKIIKTNVIGEMSYERVSHFLFAGQYHIHSVYFDQLKGKNTSFYFRGHSDRPVSLLRPFKQGEEFREIETVDVLVNATDYNDYFVLFREELNIDMSRNLYYKVMKSIDYILWYGAIIFLILYTR